MIIVTWVAARWTIRRFHVPSMTAWRLAMGVLAFALILAAELSLVMPLRGLTLEQYFATRDPVSGFAYYASLVLLALMPLIAGGPSGTSPPRASSPYLDDDRVLAERHAVQRGIPTIGLQRSQRFLARATPADWSVVVMLQRVQGLTTLRRMPSAVSSCNSSSP